MSPPIVTDGPMMAPDWGIDQAHASFGQSIGATASESWADSPLSQLMTGSEIAEASGNMPDFGKLNDNTMGGVALTEEVKPAIPRMDIIEANDRVKKAGLGKHLTLPDQPDMPPAQLEIMMRNAQARAEREATIERGPQGFIPSALQVGTSFLVGAADPINVASAFIPILGELRYGKVLAAAGDSLTARLATRAAVGAGQGAVGQAALEPLDWWAHTQEGRDFGMSDVLHNIMFGAALGGGLHAGGGFISDAYRGAKGRALYPFGPEEPLAPSLSPASAPDVASAPPETIRSAALRFDGKIYEGTLHSDTYEAASHESGKSFGDVIAASKPQDVGFVTGEGRFVSREEAGRIVGHEGPSELAAEHFEEGQLRGQGVEARPSSEVAIINDLPPRAHEDAMRVAISDLINGDAVRSGDVLDAAAQTDRRIAESLDAGRRQVVGFTTAKGSTYEIGEGGVTSRNKAARSDVGHEGDEGLKPASEKTVYADPSAATALAIPQNAKWKVIDHGDGTISLATRNDDGKWGIAPSARNVAVTDHPREGLLPIELWKREEVNGLPAYGTVHFGNEIVALKRSSAAPARDVPTSNLDKAATWRGIAHVTPDFDTPEAIAASKAAAEVKPPKTKLDERVTAAEKAEAYAKSMYDMFAHRLPEEERARLEEHIAELERKQADRDTVSQRGAACLFEGRGA